MKTEPHPKIGVVLTAWLTETETANRLNIAKKTLQKWRLQGGPLRYAKFGSAVRYSVADIEEFERDSLRSSTSGHQPQSTR